MDIRHLRYFVCLAEELHFGRAAEKLHIAQPALSIQIKNLEAFLGGALFERNKRTVTLTDAGKSILCKAREVLSDMDGFIDYADRLFQGRAGFINISYSGLAAYSAIMGDALSSFRQQYPDIEIALEEHDPHAQLHSLLAGTTHVAFMTTIGRAIPAGLHAEFITAYPLRFILPAGHPLADQAEIDNADLAQEPFVVYGSPGDSGATAVIQRVCGFTPVISHRATSPLLLPSLVSAGLGIALIPSAFDSIAQERGTIIRPLPDAAPQMDISFLYPHSRPSAAVDAFIRLVQARFVQR